MRTERPRALELVLAGAASLALLCLVHSVRGVTARTELADVSAGLPNDIPATCLPAFSPSLSPPC
jgi:hypothetical protein